MGNSIKYTETNSYSLKLPRRTMKLWKTHFDVITILIISRQDNNNNEYLERLTRTGPKRLHVLYKYIFVTVHHEMSRKSPRAVWS